MEKTELKKLTDGCDESWKRFVSSYAPLIRGMVARTLSAHGNFSSDDIDDAVQNVYLKLLGNDFHLLKSYNPRKASLSTWLGIVSRSVTIDLLRKKSRNSLPLKEDLAGKEEASGREEEIDLPKGLLSARQELVLRLIFDKEMETDEVADFLNVEVQTVRSMKHKAIEKLRRYYKDGS